MTLAFFNNLLRPGPDMLILLVLGLLIFGKRLPEVGRGLGRGIIEFKKGLKGVEDDVQAPPTPPPSLPER
jgi:TatA/E family protein of Tat protein translocase